MMAHIDPPSSTTTHTALDFDGASYVRSTSVDTNTSVTWTPHYIDGTAWVRLPPVSDTAAAAISEVDLAVLCFKVAFADSSTLYTYAALGVKHDPDIDERSWYLTGTMYDAPRGVSLDELLSWLNSGMRSVVDVWVATSWQNLRSKPDGEDE